MKTQISQEENSSEKLSNSTQNSSQVIRQGARVGKTGIGINGNSAQGKGGVQIKGGTIPATNPKNKEPIISKNTKREEERKRKRKKKGLVSVTEPKEFKRVIDFLKEKSSLAKEVIDYVNGLNKMITVQSNSRAPGTTRPDSQNDNINWFSQNGVAIYKPATLKNDKPEVDDYISPAMILLHEIVHVALRNGFREEEYKKYNPTKDDKIEHEYIRVKFEVPVSASLGHKSRKFYKQAGERDFATNRHYKMADPTSNKNIPEEEYLSKMIDKFTDNHFSVGYIRDARKNNPKHYTWLVFFVERLLKENHKKERKKFNKEHSTNI